MDALAWSLGRVTLTTGVWDLSRKGRWGRQVANSDHKATLPQETLATPKLESGQAGSERGPGGAMMRVTQDRHPGLASPGVRQEPENHCRTTGQGAEWTPPPP